MNKKAFTLIELLAVIVILAIILGIAVPTISNLIEGARSNTFTSQKKLVENAAKLYYETDGSNLYWEDNVSYVTIGTLKEKGFLEEVKNPLNDDFLADDTRVLIIKKTGGPIYALQLYDDISMDWYRDRMIEAFKENEYALPTTIGQTTIVNLEELMINGSVDELRLPLDITDRCVGYVEVEKLNDTDFEYNAYVDCLTNASTFASHYVSYGGKYIDGFNDVKQTSDGGFIAVGESNSEVITKYGNQGKGKYDGIIVKFDAAGEVEWSQNFGGTNNDHFRSVTEAPDGYIVVGITTSDDGDLSGLYKGGSNDAILVKYSKQGAVVRKLTHGSSGTNGSDYFNDIITVEGGYVVIGGACILVRDGDLTGVTAPGTRTAAVIIKYDSNFNIIWRSFFSGTYYENFSNIRQTSDNGYIISGNSSSFDYDMEGLGYNTTYGDSDAIIVKYDVNGVLEYKNSFKGSLSDSFSGVVEVSDGYIVVGNSASIDGDMVGLSKTDNEIDDAVIVKYNKTLSDVIWKKTFGGSNVDVFGKIIKTTNNQLLVVGYSKSEDINMLNIALSKNGYSNAIMVNYSNDGNVLNTKVFGGTNSDNFNNIIIDNDNNYVLAGTTYSNDYDLKNFNKGHRDAILVSYNTSFELIRKFNEPVVIIDKLKEITPNYGTNISLNYENIYTTNNPEVDLDGWCSSYPYYASNINYPYGLCLTPFNSDDLRLLTIGNNIRNFKVVLAGENEYTIDFDADNNYNWHRIYWYFTSGGGTNIEISNLKLKFEDGYIGSIRDSVAAGYIEPLVVVSSLLSTSDLHFFPNSVDIFNTGGSTGAGSYPTMDMKVKPKKSKLVSIIFTSNRSISTNNDGLQIYELRNFDMSITKTE